MKRCMSSIYKYEDWPQKIEALEKHQIEKIANDKWSAKEGTGAVADAADEENYSLTDFWSYLIVHQLLAEVSGEQKAEPQTHWCETSFEEYQLQMSRIAGVSRPQMGEDGVHLAAPP